MSSPLVARSRWASWCFLLAISIATIYTFGRNPTGLEDDRESVARSRLPDAEAELAPTLVDAHELVPIAVPGVGASSNATSSWNAKPEWRSELLGPLPNPLRSPAMASPALVSIPDAFPLEPRLKDEPPAIGEALAQDLPAVGQLQPLDAPGLQLSSPFTTRPVLPAEPNLYAKGPAESTRRKPTEAQPRWPDQTFAPETSAGKEFAATDALSTPHLLTGSVVRPSSLPSEPSLAGPLPARSAPSQPASRTGNYILQPLRKP